MLQMSQMKIKNNGKTQWPELLNKKMQSKKLLKGEHQPLKLLKKKQS